MLNGPEATQEGNSLTPPTPAPMSNYRMILANTFTKWEDKNRLTLNANKCKYMVISKLKSRALPPQAVMLFNQPMLRVSTYKYLGVIISDDLSWALHIEEITSKARKLVGMLYRNFYRWSSSDALLKLYLSLIRPHLEYACVPQTSIRVYARGKWVW